jgi:small-conductance mechanosensitive channel
MDEFLVAGGVFIAVVIVGILATRLIRRYARPLIGEDWRKSVATFIGLAAILVGLGAVAVAFNPETTDTLIVTMVRSIPSLLLAGLILVAALVLGRIAGTLTGRALRSWSSVVASRADKAVRVTVVAFGSIIALEELGVSTQLLLILITAAAIAIALAGALAVGLGSVPLARQIAAGRHVSDRFAMGTTISGPGFRGRIVGFGSSSVLVETEPGSRIEVPNELLLLNPIVVDTSPDGPSSVEG